LDIHTIIYAAIDDLKDANGRYACSLKWKEEVLAMAEIRDISKPSKLFNLVVVWL
jgi:hypothetical protein